MSGKVQMRLAVLAALAALVAVLVPATLASGLHEAGHHPEISDFPNEGVLRLQLGDVDRFVFERWNATEGAYEADPNIGAQAIGPPMNCELKGSSVVDGPLGIISSTQGNVGMDADDIGIRRSGSRGVPCGQVDSGEDPLTISLDPAGPLGDLEIDYAEIDIEGKHDVAVSIEAFLDGVSLGDPVEAFNCDTGADCGPDSGDNDNFRIIVAVQGSPGDVGAPGALDKVTFSGPWDRLDIYVSSTSGEFSLNAGADGTAAGPLGLFLDTKDSLFHLTDIDTISCGETVSIDEENNVFGDVYLHAMEFDPDGEDEIPFGWYTGKEEIDLEGQDPFDVDCLTKTFFSETTDTAFAFVPSVSVDARYTIVVTAEGQAITYDNDDGNSIPDGTITSLIVEYNGEGDLTFPDEGTESLQACEGQPIFDDPTTATDDADYIAFWSQSEEDLGILPDGAVVDACFFSVSVTATGDGEGTEIWGIYFKADPSMRF